MYFALLSLFRLIYLKRYSRYIREQEKQYRRMALLKGKYIGEHARPLTAVEMSMKHVDTGEMIYFTYTGKEIIPIEPINDPLTPVVKSRTGSLKLFTRYDAFTTPEIIEYINQIAMSSKTLESE